jgi:hypothetical protein
MDNSFRAKQSVVFMLSAMWQRLENVGLCFSQSVAGTASSPDRSYEYNDANTERCIPIPYSTIDLDGKASKSISINVLSRGKSTAAKSGVPTPSSNETST